MKFIKQTKPEVSVTDGRNRWTRRGGKTTTTRGVVSAALRRDLGIELGGCQRGAGGGGGGAYCARWRNRPPTRDRSRYWAWVKRRYIYIYFFSKLRRACEVKSSRVRDYELWKLVFRGFIFGKAGVGESIDLELLAGLLWYSKKRRKKSQRNADGARVLINGTRLDHLFTNFGIRARHIVSFPSKNF